VNACILFFCMTLSGGGPGRQPADRFFGEDKLKHFFTSFVVTSLAASGARAAGMDAEPAMWVGAGTGAAVGVLKEVSDLNREGRTASLYDIVWDLGGVGAAAAVSARVQ
jgi:putative lipoprotein